MYNNGLYGSFEYTEEILYKKRTGEYFLYGSSRPQGKYAKMISENNWSGGETIIPYTKEEAIKWLEKYDVEAIWRTGGVKC